MNVRKKFQYLGGVLEYKSLIADSNPLDTSLQVSIDVAFWAKTLNKGI